VVEGLAARLEGLDDDHTPATARAGTGQLALIVGACFFLRLFDAGGNAQELTEASEVGHAAAIGKQSVVADAVEALGNDVHEEAANELMGVERHRLPAIRSIEPIVLPAEGDTTVVDRDQSPVGDGDAVGVARQIAEDGFWPSEGLLAVNDPFDLLQRRKEGGEGTAMGEACMIAGTARASD